MTTNQSQEAADAPPEARVEDRSSSNWISDSITFAVLVVIAAAAGWISGQHAAERAAQESTPIVVLSVSDWMEAVPPGASEEESFEMMGEARRISQLLSESGVLVLRQDAVVDAPRELRITPDSVEALQQ